MRLTIKSEWNEEYEIIEWHKQNPNDTYLKFYDRYNAIQFMNNFLRDHLSIQALRQVLLYDTTCSGIKGADNHRVIEEIAHRLVSGGLLVKKLDYGIPGWGVWKPIKSKYNEGNDNDESADSMYMGQETSWLEIRLIDELEQPLKNAILKVTLAGGKVVEQTVGSQGLMKLSDVDNGNFELEFGNLTEHLLKQA